MLINIGAAILTAVTVAGAPPVQAPPAKCDNAVVRVLHDVGFRGKNLKEAWAIVMRESHGHQRAISATGDIGYFQFNRAAHHKQTWWNEAKLLTARYNATVAYRISEGGKTWYPWDIDGAGRHKARYTSRSTYNVFANWYAKFPKECAA